MEVVKAPDSRLRIKTKPVKKINQGLVQTLKDMIRLTKSFKDPEGVGLAANQVGLDERFFVGRIHDSKKNPPSKPGERKERWKNYGKDFTSVVNPRILAYSKTTKTYFEGCLSVPNMWGEVKRHSWVKVSYQDISGHNISKTLTGIPAWIFQHEVDHLNGILFSDRVLQQKGKFYKYKGQDQYGTDIFEEITI